MNRMPVVRLWIGTILLLLASLLAAFFFVFNSVFSDGGIGDRAMAFAITAGVYLILGLVSGLASPTRPRRWMWILSAPAAAILFLYTFSEPQSLLLHAFFAGLVLLAVYAGVRVGMRSRAPKKA